MCDLTEVTYKEPFLYVDLDGVLADFMRGLHGFYSSYTNNLTLAQLRSDSAERSVRINQIIDQKHSSTFFRNLQLESNAHQLLDWIKNHPSVEWGILSRPFDGAGIADSTQGKRDWLILQGIADRPAVFTADKHVYAVNCFGGPNVLVDDHQKNISAWNAAGGIGILHRNDNVQNTVNQLNDLY